MIFRRLEIDDDLASFFESLSDETLFWQNHFGADARINAKQLETQEMGKQNQNGYVAIEKVNRNQYNESTITVRHDLVSLNEIVAYGWLAFGEKPQQRFTCSLGIVVSDAYQGFTIGTELTKFMIEEARKLKMRKIFLNCYAGNVRAHRMYNKLGFITEGLFQKQEWTKDNLPLDLYSLALFL